MLPSRERFDPDGTSVLERDDGLIQQAELFPLDRETELDLELELLDGTCVHGFVEDFVSCFAGCLGPVHRGVGIAQNTFGALVRSRGDRDSDARGDEDLEARDSKGLAKRLMDAFGNSRCSRHPRHPFQEDGELVASESCHGVGRPHARAQPSRNRDEKLVADEMAEAVVDPFEPIEVEEQNYELERLFGAAGALQHAPQVVHDHRSVRKAGQVIVQCVVTKPLFGELLLGNIGERAGDACGRAMHVADRLAAGQHPQIATLGVDHAVLDLESLRSGECAPSLESPPVRGFWRCRG